MGSDWVISRCPLLWLRYVKAKKKTVWKKFCLATQFLMREAALRIGKLLIFITFNLRPSIAIRLDSSDWLKVWGSHLKPHLRSFSVSFALSLESGKAIALKDFWWSGCYMILLSSRQQSPLFFTLCHSYSDLWNYGRYCDLFVTFSFVSLSFSSFFSLCTQLP